MKCSIVAILCLVNYLLKRIASLFYEKIGGISTRNGVVISSSLLNCAVLLVIADENGQDVREGW